jgi:GMP reductase
MIMSKTYYSYQEVFLKPRYSDFHSRSEANTSIKFGNKTFKLPVVPANMECTMNVDKAKYMSEHEYFYIMHRFNADKTAPANTDNKKFIEMANEENFKNISISIGVKEEDAELIHYCISKNLRIDFLTIDIAHGHSVKMKEILTGVNRMYRSDICNMDRPFIIAGNVASPEAVIDLENWGADATKVGIAQGDACTTYGQTGFGLPMFTCIQECSAVARKPVIADGGIRTNGDFAKAIVAGGTMVMAGSIFAACIDSPAETVYREIITNELSNRGTGRIIVKPYKVYYGSASVKNKGTNVHVEGRAVELECNKMIYAEKLHEITESLQSSISYAGGDLAEVEYGIRN